MSRGHPAPLERDLFRLVNDLPSALGFPLQAVMQAGAFGAVPAAAAIAVGLRRPRLARDVAVAGVLAWSLAKVGKLVVVRGRPTALLGGVVVRGATVTGLGFPSGHAAVAAALATTTSAYLGRRGRRAIWVAAYLVALARIYVGAHFPADVVGGLALGWTVGAAVDLAFGVESAGPTETQLQAGLSQLGLAVTAVNRPALDARGSEPFFARANGRWYFVKVVDRRHRDADLMFKAWRYLAFREVADEAPFATPKQQVEHEAFVSLLAERAGVRTPPIIGIASTGPSQVASPRPQSTERRSIGSPQIR